MPTDNMPESGEPSWEIKDYINVNDTEGLSQSTLILICDWADRLAVRNAFYDESDAFDTGLTYTKATTRFLQEVLSPKAEITITFQASSVVKAPVAAGFRHRWSTASIAMTLKGKYYWDPVGHSGGRELLLNTDVLPAKMFTVVECVLFGARASADLNRYAAYENKVNSDTFLGAPAETLFFKTASAEPRTDPVTNATVYDLEIHLAYKPSNWNKFMKNSVSTPEYLYDEAGNKVYTAAAFSGLLSA